MAPIRGQTIPRLELLGALLLAKLLSSVTNALKMELSLGSPVCFTDSKVTLHWITGNREWKQFVQNRVNCIRELVPAECWKFCPGSSNPADIPSRGMNLSELSKTLLWLNGPQWLCGSSFEHTIDAEYIPDDWMSELKTKSLDTAHNLLVDGSASREAVVRCEDFSSYQRLLRVTAYVMKFLRVLKNRNDCRHKSQSFDFDLARAEIYWIKILQESLLKENKFSQWKRQFGMFVDNEGLWRCKGRLSEADITEFAKYPILLDASHHITALIVKSCHEKVLHSGMKDTLTELRSRFWIVRGRQVVKKLLFHCVICRRFDSRPFQPPPPPSLPGFRVQEAQPFAYTGVDFAGPLYIVNDPDTKVWIHVCLYTCCVTRAVHLDIVPNLTTEAFLRSFRRFSARRGFPCRMISDNGKTFKSASKVISTMLKDPVLQNFFAEIHLKWVFNLERAPWWGGIFERMVRSMKRCLKRTIGRSKLSYDELLTVVTEVEITLNSRPISYVSCDDMEEPLTPSHLLVGHRLLSLPDPLCAKDLDPTYGEKQLTCSLTRRMRYLGATLSHFWHRWRREYLTELRESHRYANKTNGQEVIAIGDIVVVYDHELPRTLWRLGKVEQLIRGSDGAVRGALVRVNSGKKNTSFLKRPIQHLYPLEVCSDSGKNSDSDEKRETQIVEDTCTTDKVQRPKRAAFKRAQQAISSCIKELDS